MQTQLTIADIAKQEGMSRALDNADRKIDNWSLLAMNCLKNFLDIWGSAPFQIEDVRIYAYKNGLENPPSERAWGGIASKAKSQGMIRFLRIEPTSSPSAHCANASVYIKNFLPKIGK